MFTSIRSILFALVAACLMISAFASEEHMIEKRAVTIPLNQQRCISHAHGLFVTYDIRVGREYTKGKCDELWKNLFAQHASPNLWSCNRLGGGHMRIIFNNAAGCGDQLNRALKATFPYIGKVMPFACNGRSKSPYCVG